MRVSVGCWQHHYSGLSSGDGGCMSILWWQSGCKDVDEDETKL